MEKSRVKKLYITKGGAVMGVGVTLVFITGYLLIIMEHKIKLSRSAIAILTGILCWIVIMFFGNKESSALALERSISESSQIIFFLLGAMAIVELIDLHGGFSIVTSRIKQKNKKKLLWIVTLITFFLSSILDNLTTTIALIMLIRKMVSDPKERALFGGMIVIAANAGGAWTVIGDVTTTMLWIGGDLTIFSVMKNLFIPSILSIIVPALIVSYKLKDGFEETEQTVENNGVRSKDKITVFCSGVLSLIMVPVFKTITSLPPFMGILFALAVMWIITEIIHKNDEYPHKEKLSVTQAIRESDIASILFFMGILLAISALGAAGILEKTASFFDENIKNRSLIAVIIGLGSSVIGNVSLVAASIKMYPLTLVPPDSHFWNLLAFSTGTGGSIFIIGSAAGIALMGLEKISFNWYLKNISLLAFTGFLTGVAAYFLQSLFFLI